MIQWSLFIYLYKWFKTLIRIAGASCRRRHQRNATLKMKGQQIFVSTKSALQQAFLEKKSADWHLPLVYRASLFNYSWESGSAMKTFFKSGLEEKMLTSFLFFFTLADKLISNKTVFFFSSCRRTMLFCSFFFLCKEEQFDQKTAFRTTRLWSRIFFYSMKWPSRNFLLYNGTIM